MGKHGASSTQKIAGGVLLGAVASALAAATLGGAGTANATCASINGIGNGGGCESTPGSAVIALGPNAKATAKGLGNTAIVIGADSTANAGKSATTDFFNNATVVGNNSDANALQGIGNSSTVIGDYGHAWAGSTGYKPAGTQLNFNHATIIGNGNNTDLGGASQGITGYPGGNNLAYATSGNNQSATVIGGAGNYVVSSWGDNNSSYVQGSNNSVAAGNGSNNSAVVIGDNNGYGGDYQPTAGAQNGNGNRLTVIGSNNFAWAGANYYTGNGLPGTGDNAGTPDNNNNTTVIGSNNTGTTGEENWTTLAGGNSNHTTTIFGNNQYVHNGKPVTGETPGNVGQPNSNAPVSKVHTELKKNLQHAVNKLSGKTE